MDNTKRFISTVKKENLLYDVTHSDFYDAGKRIDTWNEIGKKYNMTYNAVIEKWKELIELYVKQKKHEYLCFKIGERPDRTKIWKYNMDMAFLDAFIINKYTRELRSEEIEKLIYIDNDIEINSDLPVQNTKNHAELINDNETNDGNEGATANSSKRTASSIEQFSNFLERSAASIKYTCDIYAGKEVLPARDSTSLLFESLATNIKNTNLNADQLMEFQADICDFIYGKLSELNNDTNNESK